VTQPADLKRPVEEHTANVIFRANGSRHFCSPLRIFIPSLVIGSF
jgi:hypothetical protein